MSLTRKSLAFTLIGSLLSPSAFGNAGNGNPDCPGTVVHGATQIVKEAKLLDTGFDAQFKDMTEDQIQDEIRRQIAETVRAGQEPIVRWLNKVEAQLNAEYEESDYWIQLLMIKARQVYGVKRPGDKSMPGLLIINMPGPAGAGKTSLVERFFELMGDRQDLEVIQASTGEYKYPTAHLLALADQNFKHRKRRGLRGLIVDETQRYKTQDELDKNRTVVLPPDDDDEETTGRERTIVIDEEAEREKSLQPLWQAAGSKIVNLKADRASEYVEKLGKYYAKKVQADNELARIDAKITELISAKDISKEEAAANKIALETLEEKRTKAEKELAKARNSAGKWFVRVKTERPDLLWSQETEQKENPASAENTPDSAKQGFTPPEKFSSLTVGEFHVLWDGNQAGEMLKYFIGRAGNLSGQVVLTFDDAIAVHIMNPKVALDEIGKKFENKFPTRDHVIKTFKKYPMQKVIKEFEDRFGGRSPGGFSRFNFYNLQWRLPVSEAGFRKRLQGDITKTEEEFRLGAKSMGFNAHLSFGSSVFDFLARRASPYGFDHRNLDGLFNLTVRDLRTRIQERLTIMPELQGVPVNVVVNYDPKTGTISASSSVQSLAVSFHIPKAAIDGVSPVPEDFKYVKAAHIVARFLVGFLKQRSLSYGWDLNAPTLDSDDLWDIPNLGTNNVPFSVTESIIYDQMAGAVAEKRIAGQVLTDWSMENAEETQQLLREMVKTMEKTDKLLPQMQGTHPAWVRDIIEYAVRNGDDSLTPALMRKWAGHINTVLRLNAGLMDKLVGELVAKGKMSPDEIYRSIAEYEPDTIFGRVRYYLRTSYFSPDRAYMVTLDKLRARTGDAVLPVGDVSRYAHRIRARMGANRFP